ncbi:VOC family protein [Chitinophaga sedimenti]|uniref:VOC family protein n=1 Tax=Chitinophaga sedimenti TaxID=2033606 RepID=UPI00249EE02C|nr:VOC family protein [Chitinophaga sedimenti]
MSADSREKVDEVVKKALANGGGPSNDPIDHGMMYVNSFADPDGHLWEFTWMDEAAFAGQE